MKKLLRNATVLLLLWLGFVAGAYAQCVPITVTEDAPFMEDFESYSTTAGSSVSTLGSTDLPTCWSAIYAGNNTNFRPHIVSNNTSYHNASTCVIMVAGGNTYGTPNYLIMPAVTNNLATMRLVFDLETESTSNGTLSVGYMTDPADAATFVTIQSNIIKSTDPARREIDLSSVNTTGNVYIAFRWEYSTNTYWWASFDNIKLSLIPDCPAPTNLAVTPFESYTVGQNTKFRCDFSWHDASSATSYQYTFVPAGTTPTWTGITTSVTTSTSGNEVAPLEPATSYDLYVRANNCTNAAGAAGIREIAGPLTITTPCLPTQIPFTADFTGLPSTSMAYGYSTLAENLFPTCWEFPANLYNSYDCRAHVYNNTNSNNNNVLVMTAGNASTGCLAVLPNFARSITDLQISFDVRKSSADYGTFSLGYYYNDTYTELQAISSVSTGWSTYIYTISEFEQSIPSGARLAFRFKHTYSTDSYYALVDNIIVRSAPDCAMTTGLTATDVTGSSATLTWNANGSSSWIVAYGAQGFNPESPTATTQTVTTNSLALTNLTSNTNYEFYVKPVCPNNGVSYWSIAGSFVTDCEVFSVPWLENFDDATFPPSCWSTAHIEGPGTYLWQRETSTTYGGSAGSAKLPDMREVTKTNLVTPLTYIPTANSYQVSFRIYRVSNASKRREGVKVWVNTSPDTIGATPLIHITRAYQYGDVVETAAGWYQYFATIPTSGNVYIIFEGISEYGNATYIDDIAISNCYPPTSITISQVTALSANVSWTPQSEENSWMLHWATASGADSVVVNNTPSYTITGLAASSAYTVKVKSLCSANEQSYYSTPVAFSTPCPAMTITENEPYIENFEAYTGAAYGTNATMPTCWAYAGTANYTPGVWNGQSSWISTPTQSLAFYGGGSGQVVILPAFSNPINTLQLSFLYMTESVDASVVYQLGYITNSADASSFVSLENLSLVSNLTPHTILFPQYSNIPEGARMAIKYYYNTSYDYIAAIDSVVVSLAPTCVVPGNVTLSNLTSSSATLSWGAPESRTTTYQVHITDGTLNDTISTPNQYYDFTNLTPGTSYTVKVRAICPEGPTDWTAPLQFATPCAAFVVTPDMAFVETFDNITAGIPACWDNSEGTESSYRWSSYAMGYQGRCVRFDAYNIYSGRYNILKTPPIDLTQVGAAELSFYWKYNTDGSTADFSVYISTDGGTTYPTALATGLKDSDVWTLKTIDLSDYCGAGFNSVVIVFKGTSDYGYGYLDLDNVKVAPAANCDAPANLAISEITNTSVKVTWTAEAATAYNLKYISENQDTVTIPNAISPYVCTGLQGNTTYAFMVQGSCGEGEGWSLYSDPVSCQTQCDPMALPYADNFNNYTGYTIGESAWTTDTDIPDCWTSLYAGTSIDYRPKLYKGTYGVINTTDTCVMIVSSTNTSYGANNMLILPLFTTPLDSIYLSFDYTLSDTTTGDLQLGYITDATNASTFTLLTTFPKVLYSQTPRYRTIECYVTDYLTQSVTNGRLALRFSNQTTTLGYALIDNVKAEKISDCRRPSGIQATNITPNSATLTWLANGNEQGYLVSCYAQGGSSIELMPETNTVELTNLLPNTTYEVEIMADCGNDGQSVISNIYTFTTACDAFVVTPSTPFFDNFNNITSGIPDCWDNSEGTATAESYKWKSYEVGYTGRGMRFNSWSTPEGLYNFLKTRPLDLSNLVNGAEVSFKCKYPTTSATGRLDVFLVSGNDTLTIASAVNRVTSWSEFKYDISAFTGAGHDWVYLVFKGTSDYGSYYLDIDDVKVKGFGNCRTPINVRVAAAATDQVTIAWDAVEGANTYNVQYAGQDFEPGTLTSLTTTSTSYTITNLTMDTTLYVYVQADCGQVDSLSEWTEDALQVRTLTCAPITITEAAPFMEDFSQWTANTSTTNSATAQFPTCWYNQFLSTSTSDYTPHVYSGTYAPTNSDNSLIMAASSTYIPAMYVSLPQFTNDMSDLQLSFATSMSSEGNCVLTLGYMTDPYSGASFVALERIPNNYYYNAATRRAEHSFYLRDFGTIPTGALLTFRWVSTSSTYYHVCIDDVQVSIAPSCLPPATVNIEPSYTTAEVTWTPRSNETAWSYKYGVEGFDPTNATAMTATEVPFTLTNLTPNTAYDFYVSSTCSQEQSDLQGPISFRTLCDAITITEDAPYTEDFEETGVTPSSYNVDAQLPSCWAYSGPSKRAPGVYNGSYASLDGVSLTLYSNNGVGEGVGPVVAFPSFTNALNTLRIQFDYRFESSTNLHELTLGYTTNATDPSAYVPLYAVPTGSTARRSVDFYVPATTAIPAGARLAFRYVYNTSTIWNVCVDNIVVSLAPPCLEPNQVALLSRTIDEATFTWNVRGAETSWEVACVPAGSEMPVSGTTVTSDTITIDQLTPNTAYDFYVRAICSATEVSDWTSPRTFTTQCLPLTLPYFENFNSYYASTVISAVNADTIARWQQPDCWDIPSAVSGTTNITPHIYRGNNSAQERALVLLAATNSMAILPEFNTLANTEILFNTAMSSTSSGTLQLGYVVNGNFTLLVALPSNSYSSGMVAHQYDLSSYTIPANARLAFRFYYTSNTTSTTCVIDDVQVRQVRTCLAPEDLQFVSSTETTAQFTWTPKATEQNWMIEYGPRGFIPGTGTTSPVASTDATVTHTLTNLNHSTHYDAYIYAVCSAEDMSYAEGPVSFTTLCPAMTITATDYFFENFEAYESTSDHYTNAPVRPDCWDYTYNGTSSNNYSPHIYRGTYNERSSNGYLMIAGSATYGSPAHIILPAFTNDLSDLQISFTTRMSTSTSSASLQLGYVTYTGTTPTFVSLQTVPNNYYSDGSSSSHTIDLGNYTNIPAGARLAFQWSASTSTYYCVIDDVAVKLPPACPIVNDIALASINASVATLTWGANGNTAWTVAYRPSGDAAAPVTVSVTQPTVTLNGLMSGTTYELTVTPVCEGVTYPSAPFTFTTDCSVVAVPYSEDFQGYAATSQLTSPNTNPLPLCWSFIYNGNPNYGPRVYNGSSTINNSSVNNVLGMVVDGSSEATGYAIFPQFDAELSELVVAFDYMFESSSMVNVVLGYITNPSNPNTFVSLATLMPVEAVFYRATYTMSSFSNLPTNSNARLALKVNTTSSTWYCFGVDNISVTASAPACLPPTDVAVSQIKHTSALVNWSNTDPSITGWVVRCTDGVSEQTVNTTDTFVRLQNLLPETAYTVTVKPLCGGYAPTSAPVQFVTECAPILITRTNTYTEDFTSTPNLGEGIIAGVGSIPTCWESIYSGQDPNSAPRVVSAANTPTPNNNALLVEGTSVTVLPLFANPMADLRVEFTTKMTVNANLQLGYVTNPADASTFTPLTTITPATTVEQHEERVYDYLATSQTIPAEARLAFATQASAILYIDDVEVSLYQIYDTNAIYGCDSYTAEDGTVYTQTSVSINTVTETDYLHHYVDLIQIDYSTQVTVDEDACGVYVWGDTTITTSGQYTRRLQTAAGCDSLVTLNLTIRSTSSDTSVVVACDSYTWTEGDGRTYRSSRVVSHTLTDQYGCDSTLVLDLTINITEHTVDVQEACGSYTWVDGVTYTASTDTPTYTTTSSAGCDSIVTLNLTIHPEVQTDTNAAACGSFTWYGQTYTESGDYPVTLTSQYGCDSVVTLHLTIFEMPVVTITGDTEIAAGESTTLTATDNPAWNYVWSTGDRTSEITVSPAATTTYTLIVSNGPCVYNGAVTVSVSTGIHDFSTAVDRLFPMPADQYCIVEAENMKAINVYNANGQMVASYAVDRADRHRIATASYAQGVYFVKVITTDNRVLTAKMVVKH